MASKNKISIVLSGREGAEKNYIFKKSSKIDLEFQIDWSQEKSKAFS